MEPERGQQTDHTIGNAFRGFGERSVLCGVCGGKYVQTSSDALQAPRLVETAQVSSWDTWWLEVARPQYPGFQDEFEYPVGLVGPGWNVTFPRGIC